MNRVVSKSHRLRTAAISIAVLLCLSFAGCSSEEPGGSDDANSGQSSGSASTPAESGSASASSGAHESAKMKAVKTAGVLHVATITADPPFEEIDKDGKFVGYDIDLMQEIADKIGVKVEYTQTDNPGRVALLQTHKVDLVIAQFAATDERKKVISFTHPYITAYGTIITSVDGPTFSSIDQLNSPDVTIAVATGGTGPTWVSETLPNAKQLVLPSTGDDIQAVLSGQADGVAASNTQVGLLIANSDGKLQATDVAISDPIDVAIGVAKDQTEWLNEINAIVDEINANGTNAKLMRKWLGDEFSLPPFVKE